jgi:hypothetical protein
MHHTLSDARQGHHDLKNRYKWVIEGDIAARLKDIFLFVLTFSQGKSICSRSHCLGVAEEFIPWIIQRLRVFQLPFLPHLALLLRLLPG